MCPPDRYEMTSIRLLPQAKERAIRLPVLILRASRMREVLTENTLHHPGVAKQKHIASTAGRFPILSIFSGGRQNHRALRGCMYERRQLLRLPLIDLPGQYRIAPRVSLRRGKGCPPPLLPRPLLLFHPHAAALHVSDPRGHPSKVQCMPVSIRFKGRWRQGRRAASGRTRSTPTTP